MKKILLFVLIPILVLLLVAGGALAYLTISNSPQKIFQNTTNKALGMVNENQKKYTTLKSNIVVSANIESDKEDIKEINKILETSKIIIDTEVDDQKAFVYNNFKMIYNNESLLNLESIIQDEKIYIGLKDWFEKYIEISDESVSAETTEVRNKSVDTELMIEAIKQELTNELSKQSFKKEKSSIKINGQDVSATKNVLELNEEQQKVFAKEFLGNLKANVLFQNSLGDYKADMFKSIDDAIQKADALQTNSNNKIVISIYTKGLFSKVIAGSVVFKNNEAVKMGMDIYKYNNKAEVNFYKGEGDNKNTVFKIVDEKEANTKNGTMTITTYDNGKEVLIVVKYEQEGNQYKFNATMGEELSATGTSVRENNTYNGNIVLSYKDKGFGTLNLTIEYRTQINAEIIKYDTSNSVKYGEMTEEEQTTLLTNIQNSKIYELFMQGYGLNLFNNIKTEMNSGSVSSNGSEFVQTDSYIITYGLPSGWSKTKSLNMRNEYSKEGNNINTCIVEQSGDDCINVINETYGEGYTVSDTMEYTVGGTKFKYKTVMGDDCNYLYFIYNLDDNNCYMVVVETKTGSVSLEDVNYFLSITVNGESNKITYNVNDSGVSLTDQLNEASQEQLENLENANNDVDNDISDDDYDDYDEDDEIDDLDFYY